MNSSFKTEAQLVINPDGYQGKVTLIPPLQSVKPQSQRQMFWLEGLNMFEHLQEWTGGCWSVLVTRSTAE